MPTISQGDHPLFRTILKSNSQVFGSICNVHPVPARRIFARDILGFMYLKGWMPGILRQKLDALIDHFPFLRAKPGIIFQK